jgi:hypothetical protein
LWVSPVRSSLILWVINWAVPWLLIFFSPQLGFGGLSDVHSGDRCAESLHLQSQKQGH